jgi:ribosomal protein S12 methylthiotransferase
MGCAKNEVDSDHMAARLSHAGYRIVDDPESANVVIVNTCSFIQAATEESIEAILEVAGYDSVASGDSKLIVAGCMPARYGADLEPEFPEVSGYIACNKEEKNNPAPVSTKTRTKSTIASAIHWSYGHNHIATISIC